jgi:hypothetical protein
MKALDKIWEFQRKVINSKLNFLGRLLIVGLIPLTIYIINSSGFISWLAAHSVLGATAVVWYSIIGHNIGALICLVAIAIILSMVLTGLLSWALWIVTGCWDKDTAIEYLFMALAAGGAIITTVIYLLGSDWWYGHKR